MIGFMFSLNPYLNEIKIIKKVGIVIPKEKENDEHNNKIIIHVISILFLNLFMTINRNIMSTNIVLKNTLICMPHSKFSIWFHDEKYNKVETNERFFNFTIL
tara:strand:- start:114 stop:419 length:306 start_codon:yes stop_codon:yes gene_type:complete